MPATALFAAGLALFLAGALCFIYPLRWLGIRTRGAAVLMMAGGFLLIAAGAEMIDSFFVYLGFASFFAGLISFMRPLRFVHIRTRWAPLMACGFGLLLSVGVLLLPYQDKESAEPDG